MELIIAGPCLSQGGKAMQETQGRTECLSRMSLGIFCNYKNISNTELLGEHTKAIKSLCALLSQFVFQYSSCEVLQGPFICYCFKNITHLYHGARFIFINLSTWTIIFFNSFLRNYSEFYLIELEPQIIGYLFCKPDFTHSSLFF